MSRLTSTLAILCAICALAAGCGQSPAEMRGDIVKEQIKITSELADTLETITDEASLKKASGKLRDIDARIAALKQKNNRITEKAGDITEDENKEIEKTYGEQMKAPLVKLDEQSTRLSEDKKLDSALRAILVNFHKE